MARNLGLIDKNVGNYMQDGIGERDWEAANGKDRVAMAQYLQKKF